MSELAKQTMSTLARATGRTAALTVIDNILGKAENIRTLGASMQAAFEADPYRFYKEIAMPLTPKPNIIGAGDGGGGGVTINVIQVNEEGHDMSKSVESRIVDLQE